MRLRTLVRRSVDTAAARMGLLSALERRMRGRLTILMYHRVLPDQVARRYPLPPLAMPASAFRRQVRWLAGRARVLPVSEALRALERGEAREPLVSLTFDDGYRDNHHLAAPILEELGLRGTFFITAGAIRDRATLWHDRASHIWRRRGLDAWRLAKEALAHRELSFPPPPPRPDRDALRWTDWLKTLPPEDRRRVLEACESARCGAGDGRRPFGGDACSDSDVRGDGGCELMAPEHVRQLHAAGHEIGSHTMTHPLLTQLDDASLLRELDESRLSIRAMVGQDPRGVCYPGGDVDERVRRAALEVGYRYGCSLRTGRNTSLDAPMSLRRLDMNPRFVTDADGRHDPLAFRAELCLLHHGLRGLSTLSGLSPRRAP